MKMIHSFSTSSLDTPEPQPLHQMEKIPLSSQGISEPKFNFLFPRNLEASSWL